MFIPNPAVKIACTMAPIVVGAAIKIAKKIKPDKVNDLIDEIAEVLGTRRAESLRGKINYLSSKRSIPSTRLYRGQTAQSFEFVEYVVDSWDEDFGRSNKFHCHHFVNCLLKLLTGEEFLIEPTRTKKTCIIS